MLRAQRVSKEATAEAEAFRVEKEEEVRTAVFCCGGDGNGDRGGGGCASSGISDHFFCSLVSVVVIAVATRKLRAKNAISVSS